MNIDNSLRLGNVTYQTVHMLSMNFRTDRNIDVKKGRVTKGIVSLQEMNLALKTLNASGELFIKMFRIGLWQEISAVSRGYFCPFTICKRGYLLSLIICSIYYCWGFCSAHIAIFEVHKCKLRLQDTVHKLQMDASASNSHFQFCVV